MILQKEVLCHLVSLQKQGCFAQTKNSLSSFPMFFVCMFHCFIVNKTESHAKLTEESIPVTKHVFSTLTLEQAVSKKKTLANVRKHYYRILSLTLKRFLQAEVQIYKDTYFWSAWRATACYHVRIHLQRTILAKLYRLIHYVSGHWKVYCLTFTKK